MAAGKTLKSILISCGARLAPFDIKELRDLMEYDELELDTLGDQKTALFVILSDTDSTLDVYKRQASLRSVKVATPPCAAKAAIPCGLAVRKRF